MFIWLETTSIKTLENRLAGSDVCYFDKNIIIFSIQKAVFPSVLNYCEQIAGRGFPKRSLILFHSLINDNYNQLHFELFAMVELSLEDIKWSMQNCSFTFFFLFYYFVPFWISDVFLLFFLSEILKKLISTVSIQTTQTELGQPRFLQQIISFSFSCFFFYKTCRYDCFVLLSSVLCRTRY